MFPLPEVSQTVLNSKIIFNCDQLTILNGQHGDTVVSNTVLSLDLFVGVSSHSPQTSV